MSARSEPVVASGCKYWLVAGEVGAGERRGGAVVGGRVGRGGRVVGSGADDGSSVVVGAVVNSG